MSLAYVTKETRIILKVGAIIAGTGLFLYFAIQGYLLYQKLTSPPEPPKQAFGKIPYLVFPTSKASIGTEYTINTVDGKLPNLPDRVNVYKLAKAQPNLRGLEIARRNLEGDGFVENETPITSTLYSFSQSRTGIAIQYNILSKNFSISSNFMTNPLFNSTSLLPSKDEVKEDTRSTIELIGADTDDIDIDKSTVTYLQNNNGLLVEAENLASAKYAKVNFFQKAVDDIPIIYESPGESIIHFTVSYPSTANVVILEGEYIHHSIISDEKSDYPIKTAEQAFADMKSGQAYTLNPQKLSNVDITNVELRYYLSRNSEDYLLPVIVFTGINFTAYVEAIPNSSLRDMNTAPSLQ